MTKKVRVLISLVLVAVAFIAGITVYTQSNKDRSAQADGSGTTRYTVDENGKIEPPAMDSTKEKGTAENPFFILEIVPYEGMGSIGYHIAGCEPINMQKAAYAGYAIPGSGDVYTVTDAPWEYRWVSEGKPSYYPESPTIRNDLKQYGTMKYVTDGTGNYIQELTYKYELAAYDYSGTRYKKNMDDTYTPDETGTYRRLVETATYTLADEDHPGNCLWTPLPAQTCKSMGYNADYENPTHEPDENGEFKMFFEGVEYYALENIKKYEHKNNFLKESVGLAYEFDSTGKRIPYVGGSGRPTLEQKIADYKCVVYTVTPEDLNIQKDGVLLNKALIDRADLVSISSLATDTVLNAYEQFLGSNNVSYDRSGLICELNRKYVEGTTKTTFNDNPLDWPAALALYKRATSETNPLPIIWDTHTLDKIKSPQKTVELNIPGKVNLLTNGSQNNMQKLYLMLHVTSSALFESTFGDPEDFLTTTYTQTFIGESEPRTFTTPLLTDYHGIEGQSYWSFQTLYPWKTGLIPTMTDNPSNVEILNILGVMNQNSGLDVNNDGDLDDDEDILNMFHYASGAAQNMIRNGIHTFDGSTYLTSGFMSDCGVDNNQYGREVYDYFERIQDPQSEDDLSTAEVLYYLLNGLDNGPVARNDYDYRVLELQPATSYKGGTTSGTVTNDAFWRAFIANYANTTGSVTVDRMSTSEFIGKHVECVSEYDLIYVGVNTLSDNWSMDFSGTDFIYAHTGPVIHTDLAAMRGWFDPAANDAEGYFPLSGNDLTDLAEQKLIDFIQSGGPVLFGTGFYTNENATEIEDNIDRNSNVYHFAKNYVTDPLYEYALTKTATRVETENALRHGLERSRRVTLTNVTLPKLYDEDASESNKYLSGSTLTYKFTVNAPAGMQYQVELYVDINGDGVFTENERMADVDVRREGHGSNGNNIVQAGETYIVTRDVVDRKGSVAWKLDLVNTDSYYSGTIPAVKDRIVHASMSGLSAIKATEKEPLRILQIMKPSGNSLELPMDGEHSEDLEVTDTSSVKEKFWAWTRDINGLDLTFIRKTEEELKPLIEADSRYLKDNYEMVVLGFGDMYNGVTDDVVLTALNEFMNAGKAVLYTHDASSMVGTGSIYENWGEKITLAFRDRYGMDRYDVSTYKSKEVLASGEKRADYPYVTTAYDSAIGMLLLRKNNGEELSDVLGEDNGGNALAQGVTNGHIYRYAENGNDMVMTNKISKINSGAITQYPYKIPNSIPVSETHPQYYQLDMENEEMTVWYCLATSSDYSNTIQDYYKATSNDVRNNYYIYNYGNITYSGMGHSVNMSNDEIKLFINTFVAAYRAAGKSTRIVVTNDDATKNVTGGEYFLSVDVDSSDSDALLGGPEMGAFTSYKLQEVDGAGFKEGAEVTAVSKRVEFYISDDSSVGSSKYKLRFYLEDPSTGDTTVETALAVYRKSDNEFMHTKSSDRQFLAGSGNIYYVDVPMKLETVDGKTAVTSTKLRVEVDKSYYVGSDLMEAPTGNTNVNIIPRGLFDLD